MHLKNGLNFKLKHKKAQKAPGNLVTCMRETKKLVLYPGDSSKNLGELT